MSELHFFSKEVLPSLFVISTEEWQSETSSINCWLLLGEERALLVDTGSPLPGADPHLPAPKNGIGAYATTLAGGLPITCVLSHGHFDHVGGANDFPEVWMSPADLFYLDGVSYLPGTTITATIKPLVDGQVFDLGSRTATAVAIPGHTPGSFGFLDKKTGTLLSGDSIARRGFFTQEEGLAPVVSAYFDRMMEVEAMGITGVASAHDPFVLPPTLIRHYIRTVCDGIAAPNKEWSVPGIIDFCEVCLGEHTNPEYINCSVPKRAQAEVAKALAAWKAAHPDLWTS